MNTACALIIWVAVFGAALIYYAIQKEEPTYEENRKKCFRAGGTILLATIVFFIVLISNTELSDNPWYTFSKDYVSLVGSVVGGNLFVNGILKKTKG